MITRPFAHRLGIGVATLALAVIASACDSQKSATPGQSQASGNQSSTIQTSPASQGNAFNLGGVYQVNLHYDSFTYGPECPPQARNSQPFDVSYRASAQGANVTLKNLGQGFDMTGTGQPDGTLSLSGGMDLVPGVRQSGTLKGRWAPQQTLTFEAGILLEMTPPQGAKQTCNVKAKATGSATRTT